MKHLPTTLFLLLACLLVLPACGGSQPLSSLAPASPATISGVVFRDLNSDGIRDAREPGEPGVTVSAYDAQQRMVCTATSDVSGGYVLNAELDGTKIVAGEAYAVVFSGWPAQLAPGPHGQDSGTEQQFVTGGATGVSLGLFSPGQYVPLEATVVSLIAQQTAQASTPEAQPAATVTSTPTVSYDGTGPAPDLPTDLVWLNTGRPLAWADLKGKVVLLEFWTYGCINSIHALPRLKMLQEEYAGELVVIGVHSAKFPHEGETDNLRQIIHRYGIDFPVINDKDYVVAGQYDAHIWPTYVVINPLGRYVGSRSGEMLYPEMDRLIREMVRQFDARGEMDRTPLDLLQEQPVAVESPLRFPNAVLADETDNRLFIVDSNHNRIVISNLAGAVQDVIGNGQPAWQDGDYATASFYHPQGITLAGDNTLYVADTENQRLRRVDLQARTVTTVAGTGEQFVLQADAGPALQSRLNSPWAVLYVDGRVYIAMAGQHQVWAYDPAREWLEPFAGTGTEELTDGPLLSAGLNQPTALTTDGSSLYIADSEASAVRQAELESDGMVRTIVGLGFYVFGDTDGIGDVVRLQRPAGIAYWNGLLYVADTYNNKIKTVNPATNEAATFLGTGKAGLRDGTDPLFNEPSGLSIAAGRLYIADINNHAIRIADLATGQVSTLVLVDPNGLLATSSLPTTSISLHPGPQ